MNAINIPSRFIYERVHFAFNINYSFNKALNIIVTLEETLFLPGLKSRAILNSNGGDQYCEFPRNVACNFVHFSF